MILGMHFFLQGTEVSLQACSCCFHEHHSGVSQSFRMKYAAHFRLSTPGKCMFPDNLGHSLLDPMYSGGLWLRSKRNQDLHRSGSVRKRRFLLARAPKPLVFLMLARNIFCSARVMFGVRIVSAKVANMFA